MNIQNLSSQSQNNLFKAHEKFQIILGELAGKYDFLIAELANEMDYEDSYTHYVEIIIVPWTYELVIKMILSEAKKINIDVEEFYWVDEEKGSMIKGREDGETYSICIGLKDKKDAKAFRKLTK